MYTSTETIFSYLNNSRKEQFLTDFIIKNKTDTYNVSRYTYVNM